MRLPPLVRGCLIERENRFLARVSVDGHPVLVHVADPGRAKELLVPGRTVWSVPAQNPRRKTAYTLVLVEHGDVLVSMRSYLANDLLAEALAGGRALRGPYERVEREVQRGASRPDFRLTNANGICWVEAKSVTLVEDGIALFPDAPTVRGRRHVEELTEIVTSGGAAAVAFVVQRPDAERIRPHVQNDPEFAAALAQAAREGVRVYGYGCHVTLEEIRIGRELPVNLDEI